MDTLMEKTQNIPEPLLQLLDELKTISDFEVRYERLSQAVHDLEGFTDLDMNLYYYHGFYLRHGLQFNENPVAELLEKITTLELVSAPVLVAHIPIGQYDSLTLTYWPGCDLAPPVPYQQYAQHVSVQARERFLADMHRLGEQHMIHTYATMGLDYWLVRPSDGAILLDAWESVETNCSDERVKEALLQIEGLLHHPL